MANPAIVVILVAAAEAQDPSVLAATRAARDALGPGAVVAVQEVETLPSSSAAASIGAKVHADAVASVTWTLPERRRAHIRVVAVASGSSVERDLEFAPGDADVERGRTIGLTIVALVPEPAPAKPSDAPPSAPPRPTEAARPTEGAPRFGLDAFGLAASGPLTWGGGLAGRFLTFPAPRAAIALRAGTIADASLRVLDVSVGIAPQLLDMLGARLELGLTQQSATLRGEERSRLTAHARALGEVVWWTTSNVGVGLGAGVEFAFGETRVLVGDVAVASIPRARFVFELCLRARK